MLQRSIKYGTINKAEIHVDPRLRGDDGVWGCFRRVIQKLSSVMAAILDGVETFEVKSNTASFLCLSQESMPLPSRIIANTVFEGDFEEWIPVTSTGMTNYCDVLSIHNSLVARGEGVSRIRSSDISEWRSFTPAHQAPRP